jgi:hypothetical protein
MQKLKVGCLTVVCLMAILLLWLNFTPALRPEIAPMLAATQKEFDARQQLYANDAASNIYLDSKFREVWCLDSELVDQGGKITPGPVNRTIMGFSEFHEKLTNNQNPIPIDQLATIPTLVSGRQAFKRLLPDLEKALSRAVFVGPNQKLDTMSRYPRFMGLRRACLGLNLEAELENFEKKPEDAWLRLKASFNAGAALRGAHPTMLELMMSVAIQSSACDSLYQMLAKHPKLSDNTLKEIAVACQTQGFAADSLAKALETEVVSFDNTYRSDDFSTQVLQANGLTGRGLWFLAKYSGLAAREWRLSSNDWYSLVESSRKLSTPDLSWTKWGSYGRVAQDWILGNHGIVSAAAIPNFGRTQVQINKVRSKIAAIEILVALERYRAQHGHFPKSLKELELKTDPKLLETFHYSLKGQEPQLTLDIDPELKTTTFVEELLGRLGGLDGEVIRLLPYRAPSRKSQQPTMPEALQDGKK